MRVIGFWGAAAIAVAIAAPVVATAAEIGWQPYDHKLRSGEVIPAQVGALSVPVRRGGAGGGAITLKFVRLPATGPASGPPIVYLAGGPGSSGIEAAQGDRWPLFAALRKEGDVILLDQRGVGASSPPPPCSTPWSFPNDQASTESTFNASLEAAASKCAAEWRAKGVDLDAYNTADNAADVADLAEALGGKVRLVSISYGTFLAFAVLRDHASVVDRVVLAGTEGPDNTLKLPLQADRVLAGLSAYAVADAKAAALTPDLEKSFHTVIARLDKAPVLAEAKGRDGKVTQVLVSKYDVQVVSAFLLATSANAVKLPGLVSAMEKGDFSGMANMVLFLRRFLAPLPAMPLAMDAASPVSPARVRAARAEVSRSVFGNAVNVPSADFARALGVKPLPEQCRAPIKTSVPGLFISGDLDSRTPPANAEAVRKGFRTSAHLVLQGAGHDNDLFLSSPVIIERIAGFLRGEPAKDETIKVDILNF